MKENHDHARLHRGVVVPDPRFLDGTVDLLAAENGGRLVGCSDAFYASPANIILPGRARNMGEGWENARRPGTLPQAGEPDASARSRHVEIYTSYYVGNAPGWVRLSAIDARSADSDDDSAWTELLPRIAVQPDTRHRFVLDAADADTNLQLEVNPVGGLSNLRLFEYINDRLSDRAGRWDPAAKSPGAGRR
jgi:allantoicase